MDALHCSDGPQEVRDRVMLFCPFLQDRPGPFSDFIRKCADCKCFYVDCCSHFDRPSYFPCHHYWLAFTDGACLDNGRHNAVSGVGVAMGDDPSLQLSIGVDDRMDTGPRTNQRAELLGALEGLAMLDAQWELNFADEQQGKRVHGSTSTHSNTRPVFVIASDSEYVVKGMTQWYPAWKRRNWRTANNMTPTNLDLFHLLNARISEVEAKGIQVGFWRIPRRYNPIADALAKEAAASMR